MSGEKLLIIEDEVKIARFLELELIHEGYSVKKEHDGRTGLEAALADDYDLIILDVLLPSLNGMEVLRRVRQAKQTPVIMLTAKSDVTDKVMGLDIGADDYLTKPFEIEELLARIRVALRKVQAPLQQPAEIVTAAGVTIDKRRRSVSVGETAVELTKKEYDLLVFLFENLNIPIGRESILDHVWGYEYYGDTNVVDVYIRYLRSKIDDAFGIKVIHTIRGVGYVVRDE